MSSFSIIVAMDQERGIGKSGGLPWHLPADLKHFKEITARTPGPCRMNVVIMGRKTWDSLPERFRPLPQRINIVLTRDAGLAFPAGVLSAGSLQDAFRIMEQNYPAEQQGDVFVIGGGHVFSEAILNPSCQKLYLTHLHSSFACDTFFPEFPERFRLTHRSQDFSENGISFHFANYEAQNLHG